METQFGNTPGMIIWENLRVSSKYSNAPESGGTFYNCMATKVGEPCLDYKAAEMKNLPKELKELNVTLNCRLLQPYTT